MPGIGHRILPPWVGISRKYSYFNRSKLFSQDTRTLVRGCTGMVTCTAHSLSPQLTGNSSSLVRRPALLTRAWIHYRFSGTGSNPDSINSWIVGSLYSAWRAVDQYLIIHRPDLLKTFRKRWGPNEYWDDEASIVDASADSYQTLLERHLAICFRRDGIEPGTELPVPSKVLEEYERAKTTA